MEKNSIIGQVVESLALLGIVPAMGVGADLTVDEEFLDTKWSTGQKKISYHNSAYLDDQEKILYYWESTKELGSGFSFGSTQESSFQSGMTLMRKVKKVQYGPEGKVFEVDLDLGAITKAYKEAAKSMGWKFKVVLNRDKASYPLGFVPVAPEEKSAPREASDMGSSTENTEPEVTEEAKKGSFCQNCGSPLSGGAKFCEKCGAPTDGDERGKLISKAKTNKSASLPKEKRSMKKGCLLVLVGVLALFIVILLIGMLSSGDDKEPSDSTGGIPAAEGLEESIYFVDLGTNYSVYPALGDQQTPEQSTYYLGLYNSIIHGFYFEEDSEDINGSKIKEVRIKDFTITDPPNKGIWDGTLKGSFMDPMLGSAFDMEYEDGTLTADVSSVSESNNGWSGAIVFEFHMVEMGSVTYGDDYSGMITSESAYEDAGVTWEEVAFGFSYVMEIVTFGGDVYQSKVEISTPSGDFIFDSSYQTVDESVWEASQGKPFVKIK